jgi:hypothetical protein
MSSSLKQPKRSIALLIIMKKCKQSMQIRMDRRLGRPVVDPRARDPFDIQNTVGKKKEQKH